MHGIERERELQGPQNVERGVQRVVVRYSDGRVLNFIPDAGREIFNQDDMKELQRVLIAASSTAEWAEVAEQQSM